MAKKQSSKRRVDLDVPVADDLPLPANATVRCLWLGGSTCELGWFRERVLDAWPTLTLDSPALQEAFAAQLQPTHLFLASRSRSEALVDVYSRARDRWPMCEILVVLGAWWTGHRRCEPLPDHWTTVYWYEWWDRASCLVQPRLISSLEAIDVPAGWNPRTSRIRREAQLRDSVQPVMSVSDRDPRMALVTCADRTSEEMWDAILRPMGFRSIFRRMEEPIPRGVFELHVVDAASFLLDAARWEVDRLAELLDRSRVPFAKCLVRTGFPEFLGWQNWQAAGADWIVGSPYHLPGLRELLGAAESHSIGRSRLPSSAGSR